MKIKISHVTNSSSVSFCGWGIRFDINQMKEKHPKVIEKIQASNKNLNEFEIRDILYGALDKVEGLEVLFNEGDDVILGRPLSSLKDDETLKEFKLDTINKLSESGFEISYEQLKFIEDSWYNG